MMERRVFLRNVGLAILSIQVLPRVAAHADDGEQEPYLSDEALVVQSGDGFVPHKHDLMIPLRDLENPPAEGIKIKTERKFAHFHYVELTQEQLGAIYKGETVVVKDSFPEEHLFRIRLP